MAKRIAILALAVWFGGLNCLAGCAAEVLAAALPDTHHQTKSKECTDNCCKRESGSQPAKEEHDQPAHTDECCPFLTAPPSITAKKTEVAPMRVVDDHLAERAAPLAEFCSESRLPEFLPDDGRDTHQRCHVLRI